MTSLATQARSLLVTGLAATGMKVHPVAPATPKPPCIVLVPETPWINVQRIGSNLAYEVRLRILIVIAVRSNDAIIGDSETAVDKVLQALPSGYSVSSITAPTLTDVGAQGTVATTEISVSVSMKE